MMALSAFAFGGLPGSDERLLTAEEALDHCLARAQVQQEIDAADRLMEPLLDEIGRIAETIHNTPPSTLVGAAVKLRLLLHPLLGIEDDESSELRIALQQILDCVEQSLDPVTPRSS